MLLSLTASVFGTEPFRPDVTGEVNTEWAQNVDHLEPGQGELRLPEYHYLAQFIEVPGTTAGCDYVAVLRTDDGRYLVRVSKIPMERTLSEPSKPDLEIEVPQTLASVVYDLWVNALLEVRYDRRQHGGYHGETYLFSTFVTSLGWMHGSTSSPGGDLPPVWMVKAGKKLVTFARDEKREAKTTEAELTVLRDELFRYIKAHGKH